jgi:hypothetical protein
LNATSIFKDSDVAKHMSYLNDKYVVVSAGKTPNNVVFVCKSHNIDWLIKEYGIGNSLESNIYPDKTKVRGNPRQSYVFCVPLEFQPKIKKLNSGSMLDFIDLLLDRLNL